MKAQKAWWCTRPDPPAQREEETAPASQAGHTTKTSELRMTDNDWARIAVASLVARLVRLIALKVWL
jgi:hypothetical protein